MRRFPVTIAIVIAIVVIVGFSIALTDTTHSDGDPAVPPPVTDLPSATSSSSASPAADGSVLGILDSLPVKGKSPMTGYDRVGDFGRAWIDVDHNGCDTRNDILNRDLSAKRVSGHCEVETGTLLDPYTGTTIHFVRGVRTSALVQIDHIVPLGDAWQTGAQKLTESQRIALANDPLELLAVDGPTNESKGDGDAATWLPPHKAFRCTYVTRQAEVKAKYHLWITSAEKAAITRILARC